mgnify:CR=1 FL=1|tara:strand:+ start:187 stop:1200 length:1014 start_codon:yes stop_codon:yes gene_type:complete
MKDIFKERTKNAYWEVMKDFIESIEASFPDCDETGDYVSWVKKFTQEEKDDHINKWFQSLHEPIQKAKYGKAVERITGKPAKLYHACAYKDHECIHSSCSSFDILNKLNIHKKMSGSELCDTDKTIFWKYIYELNRLSSEYMNSPLPDPPTREQISENIKQSKRMESKDSKPTMVKGFITSLNTLADSVGKKDVYSKLSDDDIGKLYNEWCKTIKNDVSGETVSDLIQKKNKVAVEHINSCFPELEMDELTSTQWSLVSKMCSFSTVGDAIPTHMMGKIENMASKLAEDIMQGKSSLADMNLESIGKQVLSQCNQEDMSQFANNIDKLLPAITQLHQ